MPFTTTESARKGVNIEQVSLDGFKEWVGSKPDLKSEINIEFNSVHLDYVADKLSDYLELEGQNRVSGQDVLQMIYEEISGFGDNFGGGVASARKMVGLLNDYSQIAMLNGADGEEALQKEIDALVRDKAFERGFTPGFIGLIAGAVCLGATGVGLSNSLETGPVALCFTGIMFGGVAGAIIGGKIIGGGLNRLYRKEDIREARKQLKDRLPETLQELDGELRTYVEEERFETVDLGNGKGPANKRVQFKSSVPVPQF